MTPLRTQLLFATTLFLIGGTAFVYGKFERERVAQLQKEFIAEQENTYQDYDKERLLYDRYLKVLTPAQILDTLEKKYPYCHSEAHYLGREILKRSTNIYDAIEACGARCGSGCFHGVVIQSLQNQEDALKNTVLAKLPSETSIKELAETINGWCDNPITSEIHPRKGGCIHSAGHAFLIYHHYDIGEGLAMCRGFEDAISKYYCAHGVFMEYFDELKNKDSKVKDYNAHNPLSPCDVYNEFPAACYRYKMQRLFIDRPKGQLYAEWLPYAITECRGLTGLPRLGCFHGIGFASLQEIVKDPTTLSAACSSGTPAENAMCIEGAIEVLSERDEARTEKACNSLSGDMKKICTDASTRHMFSMDIDPTRYVPN